MTARLYIAVPVFNRRAVVEQCVPTIRVSKEDAVILYDDGSTEYDGEFWARMAPHITGSVQGDSMGIDAQRRKHILEFLGNREIHGCTHLYLCDSDSPHDPHWRSHALELQTRYKAPICLYRTKTHSDYENNIFFDDTSEDVIWQRFSPGVSLLLSLEMVARVVAHIPERWSWDWHLPGLLGYRMAVSRMSHCCHIGRHGLHDEHATNEVSKERCTNPTQWLIHERMRILAALNLTESE